MYDAPSLKPTLEVRWFFDQAPFSRAVFFPRQQEPGDRVDWYAFPCHAKSGIKFRQGRLETKLQTDSIGTANLAGNDVQGVLESWTKWSVEIPPEDPHPSEDLLRATGWVAVRKQRFLRSFELTSAAATEVPSRTGDGCDFELTILELQGRSYWTVGLEAVGATDNLRAMIMAVVEATLVAGLPRNELCELFRIENSFSYPAWLRHAVVTT
ncbi:MAG: hypothetical protein KDA60_05135 [Planctomycetales bacterium]|nr:hypothetical protein [Planctomycetales bacterium]